MGAGVSGWSLANAVSRSGQLGVVSGTALEQIFVRKLQMGDPGGHLRKAARMFPDPKRADRVMEAFYIPGGKPGNRPFTPLPMYTLSPDPLLMDTAVIAAFVEVFLARQGHDRPVGINLLEKIQFPTVYLLYGAMLAGVGHVFMGAGIPKKIPGILERLACHEPVSLKIDVENAGPDVSHHVEFDPQTVLKHPLPLMKKPKFIAIVSSVTLASMMKKKADGPVDGLVVESPLAGGHNAPPRGKPVLNGNGEPVYGKRDEVDLSKIKALGLPFWLAGSWFGPEKLREALSFGAQGVQIGTAFAFSKESCFTPALKEKAKQLILEGRAVVRTDPHASPTGFPFKIFELKGSLSQKSEYGNRPRICDIGYLRHPYQKEDGSVGYRCPAEPETAFVRKGGIREETRGKICLCNALVANIGLGQYRENGNSEKMLVTSGSDFQSIIRFLRHKNPYEALDVIRWVLDTI